MLRNVQALRGIAAVAVVAAHISDPAGIEKRWLPGDLNWTGPLHDPGQAGVDLFFVISGLIMVVTTRGHNGGIDCSRRFLLRRMVRIYPLYWLATAPLLVLFLTDPKMLNSSAEHLPRIPESLFLLPQPGLPLLMVGWTLTFEMYFYAVFASVLLVPRRGRLPALLLWGAVTIGAAAFFTDSTNPWMATVAAPIALEFLFGVLVGELISTDLPVPPLWLTVGAGAGAVVATTLAPFPGTWFRAVPVGLLLAVTVHGVVALERRDRWVAPRWLQRIGDASYSMYLWHILLLGALGRLVLVRLPEGPVVHALALIIVLAVITVASLLLHRFVERPLTTWLRGLRPRLPTVPHNHPRHAA